MISEKLQPDPAFLNEMARNPGFALFCLLGAVWVGGYAVLGAKRGAEFAYWKIQDTLEDIKEARQERIS